MKLLIPRSAGGVIKQVGADVYTQRLGMLLSPRRTATPKLAAELGAVWAVDNDCYAGFDYARFMKLLRSAARFTGCKFVAAPDVVADAQGTAVLFRIWQPIIRHFGLPVALVAQDGLEQMTIGWDSFDALFIGGSTAWKLSETAAQLALDAKARGKWVHMGRVNSIKRVIYADFCDSADGLEFGKYSRRALPRVLPHLHNQTVPMWEGLIAA